MSNQFVTTDGLRRLAERCVHLKEVSVDRNYPANEINTLKQSFPHVRWSLETADGGENEDDLEDDMGDY